MRHFSLLGLLLGMLLTACAKKEDPVLVASNTASYVLDGQAVSAKATQSRSTGSGYETLTLQLTTVPQPSAGPTLLFLSLRKTPSQSDPAFDFSPVGGLVLYANGSQQALDFQNHTSTLTYSNGSVSGTFTGEARTSTGTVTHTISAGTLTDVKP